MHCIVTPTHRHGKLELEWGSVEERQGVVLTGCGDPEWSLRPEIHGIHWFTLPHDVTHRCTSVRIEHMAKPGSNKIYKMSNVNWHIYVYTDQAT